jgi:hypothetical protein
MPQCKAPPPLTKAAFDKAWAAADVVFRGIFQQSDEYKDGTTRYFVRVGKAYKGTPPKLAIFAKDTMSDGCAGSYVPFGAIGAEYTVFAKGSGADLSLVDGNPCDAHVSLLVGLPRGKKGGVTPTTLRLNGWLAQAAASGGGGGARRCPPGQKSVRHCPCAGLRCKAMCYNRCEAAGGGGADVASIVNELRSQIRNEISTMRREMQNILREFKTQLQNALPRKPAGQDEPPQ